MRREVRKRGAYEPLLDGIGGESFECFVVKLHQSAHQYHLSKEKRRTHESGRQHQDRRAGPIVLREIDKGRPQAPLGVRIDLTVPPRVRVVLVDRSIAEPFEQRDVQAERTSLLRDDLRPKLLRISAQRDVRSTTVRVVGYDDGEGAGEVGFRGLSGFVDEEKCEVRIGEGDQGVGVDETGGIDLEAGEVLVRAAGREEVRSVEARRDDDLLGEKFPAKRGSVCLRECRRRDAHERRKEERVGFLVDVAERKELSSNFGEGTTWSVESEKLVRSELALQSHRKSVGRRVGCTADLEKVSDRRSIDVCDEEHTRMCAEGYF